MTAPCERSVQTSRFFTGVMTNSAATICPPPGLIETSDLPVWVLSSAEYYTQCAKILSLPVAYREASGKNCETSGFRRSEWPQSPNASVASCCAGD